jgi:threonine aldolase
MSENTMHWIDLRSDTVTQPSAAMRAAMAAAEVGDDVYADDPTVNRLQDFAAELFGFEAGLFAPSGTQTNLIALMTHCGRGDEYLVGQEAHTYKYEGGGAAVLGSIQPQPIANQPDGSIALADIAAYIKPDDMHFARTRLLALENTIGGRVLPQDYVKGRDSLAHAKGLATHLDGARVCNAAVKQGISLREAVEGFRHRVGLPVEGPGRAGRLGAARPEGLHRAGQALAQDAGRRHAPGRRDRRGGQYALEHNVERLADDHRTPPTCPPAWARSSSSR